MIHASSSKTLTSTPPVLRRVDGIELPAAGIWTVPGRHASMVARQARRWRGSHERHPRVVGASLVIGDDPDQALVEARIDSALLHGTGPAATAPPVHVDVRSIAGRHPWALRGSMIAAHSLQPVRATLHYEGVWRRGALLYGWFVLVADVDQSPATGELVGFRLDLMASPPHVDLRSPADASNDGATARREDQACGAS